MKTEPNEPIFDIGWCECASLPLLKIPVIETRIVPDARFSMLHVFHLSTFKDGDDQMVSFGVHPLLGSRDIEIYAVAPVTSRRLVTVRDHKRQWCYGIKTALVIGPVRKQIELFLAPEPEAEIRLALAATTLSKHLRVDPERTHLISDDFSTF